MAPFSIFHIILFDSPHYFSTLLLAYFHSIPFRPLAGFSLFIHSIPKSTQGTSYYTQPNQTKPNHSKAKQTKPSHIISFHSIPFMLYSWHSSCILFYHLSIYLSILFMAIIYLNFYSFVFGYFIWP